MATDLELLSIADNVYEQIKPGHNELTGALVKDGHQSKIGLGKHFLAQFFCTLLYYLS